MHVSLPTDAQSSKQNFISPEARDAQVHVPVQIPFQIEERWLELPDGSMRYLKAGSGPPIILIHGLMGYAFSWRFTIPALAPHATVYAIDNLGAGLSPAREGIDCTVRATAERVLQFADALGIRNFDVLGTSHGGGVAMMLAAVCAERCAERIAERSAERCSEPNHRRLQRLILVAPVNPWSPHGKRFAPFIGSGLGALLFLNAIESWRSLDELWLRRLFGDVARIPPDSLEGYRIPALKNHALRHAVHIAKNWTADLAELERAIPKISDYPTLLIWGKKDRAVAFGSAEPLRRNFSNARLVAFNGVGHLPYEEAPEDFNRALADFLTASPSSFPVPSSQ
jgi:pimeloyl-ACP methyl ester carboxylesterase